MEKVVTVKLVKDSDGNYALNVMPLSVTVSPRVEDEIEENEPVKVKWVLVEEPDNPGFPNAKQLTASFKATATPFSTPAPAPTATESYSTPVSATGAEVASARVQETSVGQDQNAISLYAYSISVQTNDGKTITLDPHVRVRRRSIRRSHSDL